MDKQQARNLIKETFEQPFDKTRFIAFIKNLLNRIEEAPFSYQGKYIPDAYNPYVSTLQRIGKFNDGEHKIDILVIRLKKETSLERARTMQRNFVAWYLNGSRGGELKDAALVAYISPDGADWRFSLVKMDYKFVQTPTGGVKVEEDFTPARRWSFLVGENENSHTAQSRLVHILANDEQSPTLAELEDAFNIETVTKEFFLKYRDLFIRAKEALDEVVREDARVKADFEAKGVNTVDFAKKLLGQIIFLYFLQKKGWFGAGRDADWGDGSKHFLRELFDKKHGGYNNFFDDILEPLFYEALRTDRSHDDDYYSRFNCKIPFLNGGLFDPIGNYDWVHTDIHLPHSLFSNTVRTKEGDCGDGILDIFDRYNFTVKEDEPLDKEVAIDPELLGKAYEKFNAIRPDNFEEYKKALKSGKKGEETKFNKQFGVYYTPREIVHYMCQQSLINYLATELEGTVAKEDIEILILSGEQVSENEVAALTKEQNIRAGKQKTSGYKLQLPESIRSNAALIDQKLADITVCDPAVGSGAFPVGMMSEIVRARNVLSIHIQDKTRTPYDFKRRCIEHSLYGVDIDPGAVEIAKLRLWLSLVVDEDDIKNIKPLPNLDYKIVCGNSLLGVEKNLFNNHLFAELEKLKPLYFNETNPTKKHAYKKQIDGLISRLTDGHKEFDFEVYFSEVFHEKGGFDVVTANPPYILLQNTEWDKAYIEKLISVYSCAQYKVDTYHLFSEKGISLLRHDGILAYITPNTFLKNTHTNKLREIISTRTRLLNIILFHVPVFEDPSVDNLVFLCQKHSSPQCLPDHEISIHEIKANNFEEEVRNYWKVSQCKIVPPNYFFAFDASDEESTILSKIDRGCTRLGNIGRAYFGIQTFGKHKYVSTTPKHKFYKPVINGGNVFRYFISDFTEYLDYRPENIKSGGDPNVYSKQRIVVRQIGKYPEGSVCPDGLLTLNTIYNIFLRTADLDIRYVLALLNSKVVQFYWLKKFYDNKETFPKIKKSPLESIPVKTIGPNKQRPFINIVHRILSLTQSDDYPQNPTKQAQVKAYDKQIDRMVYELYGLTEEEIKIVEGGDENAR